MAFLGFILLALQIYFAVHAINNRKDPFWIWLIILAPGIGCAIYFITQFGPEAAKSNTARKAKEKVVDIVDPKRDLREKVDTLSTSDTVENRVKLAEELIDYEMYEDASEILRNSLNGVHENDPGILSLLARTYFLNGRSAQAVATLDTLIERNPDHRSPDDHLLYARALEGTGAKREACEEYEVLRDSYPGEEARVRYGLLLKQLGQFAYANELFEETIKRSRRAPRHYRAKEKAWLDIAKREIG